jgi:hypothetical protein
VTLWADANPPVPLKLTPGWLPGAVVLKLILPEDGLGEIGLNDTVMFCEPFTGSVTGKTLRSALNPPPLTLALLTVTGVFPVLNRVTVCRDILPSTTVPNEIVAGFAVTEVVGVVPFPLAMRDTTGDELALLVNVSTPVTDPVSCGENETVTIWLAPAAKVNGKVGLTILKPDPLMVPANTAVLPAPGFDIVKLRVTVVPTFTFPK